MHLLASFFPLVLHLPGEITSKTCLTSLASPSFQMEQQRRPKLVLAKVVRRRLFDLNDVHDVPDTLLDAPALHDLLSDEESRRETFVQVPQIHRRDTALVIARLVSIEHLVVRLLQTPEPLRWPKKAVLLGVAVRRGHVLIRPWRPIRRAIEVELASDEPATRLRVQFNPRWFAHEGRQRVLQMWRHLGKVRQVFLQVLRWQPLEQIECRLQLLPLVLLKPR
mmetsp:Transcript_29436/g.80497  ORF Transcript_29436/g.80497 Transcript_29436/m.80497 type:complete len:222 (-) Transcript_29436:56-721(-)